MNKTLLAFLFRLGQGRRLSAGLKYMNTQNHYELFSTDLAECNKKHLKEKLAITLIQLIRSKDWNQSLASEHLRVSQPRISDLMRGKIDRFSIDSLLEMMFRSGYSFEYMFDFSGEDKSQPRLEMKLKKTMQ